MRSRRADLRGREVSAPVDAPASPVRCSLGRSAFHPRIAAVSSGRFHLTFPRHLAQEPVIHSLGQRFGIVTNIRRASVDDRNAWVILEMDGPDDRVGEAVDWLAEQDVQVEGIEESG
jgi:hypothetical protein